MLLENWNLISTVLVIKTQVKFAQIANKISLNCMCVHV